jgi:hypothetical protein
VSLAGAYAIRISSDSSIAGMNAFNHHLESRVLSIPLSELLGPSSALDWQYGVSLLG